MCYVVKIEITIEVSCSKMHFFKDKLQIPNIIWQKQLKTVVQKAKIILIEFPLVCIFVSNLIS